MPRQPSVRIIESEHRLIKIWESNLLVSSDERLCAPRGSFSSSLSCAMIRALRLAAKNELIFVQILPDFKLRWTDASTSHEAQSKRLKELEAPKIEAQREAPTNAVSGRSSCSHKSYSELGSCDRLSYPSTAMPQAQPELKKVSVTLFPTNQTTEALVQYLDKRLFVQLNGSRKVIGILRGYDVRSPFLPLA